MNNTGKLRTDRDGEIWRDIEEFDGYQVSNKGRVRSKDRIIEYERNGQTRTMRKKGKIKTQYRLQGYPAVALYKSDTQYNRRVHHLVLKAFDRQPKEDEQCNHINGDKEDNRIENLEWVTRQENIDHAVRTGLTRNGEEINTSKLTETQVRKIKSRLMKGESQTSIAQDYPVKQEAISAINTGQNWSHVKVWW
jgi:hypothetical protein